MENNPKPNVVLGYNHNINHKGNVYHVQTEDSGKQNPHIITHLFVGGNIIATKKTSYADIVHAENLDEIVRELMQEQHKAMLRNLVNGIYDSVSEKDALQPKPSRSPRPGLSPFSEQLTGQPPSIPKPVSGKFPPAHTQAAKQSFGSANQARISPPAPEVAPTAADVASRPTADSDSSAVPARQAERGGVRELAGPTIFGEDLITEKSLDEVILGYLSGDGGDEG